MFSQILESLNDCKMGDVFFSLREVKKIRYDENWKRVYDSSRSRSKPIAAFLSKQNEINSELNVSEHMYIKYDAYTFHMSTQCSMH